MEVFVSGVIISEIVQKWIFKLKFSKLIFRKCNFWKYIKQIDFFKNSIIKAEMVKNGIIRAAIVENGFIKTEIVKNQIFELKICQKTWIFKKINFWKLIWDEFKKNKLKNMNEIF